VTGDIDRRGFFRSVANDIVQTAGVALEAAATLNRAAAEAGSALTQPSDAVGSAASASAAEPAPPATASERPFRIDGTTLFLVDDTRLPDAVVEVECRSPADVAAQISRGAMPDGLAAAQVAAMSLALAASETRDYLPSVRTALMHVRAASLTNARPWSQYLASAVARMEQAYDAADAADAAGAAIASAMRAEAEAISVEAEAAVAGIARQLVGVLAEGPGAVGGLLVDPSAGAFVASAARELHVAVHVLEGGPARMGARVVGPGLDRAGVGLAVVPDAAAGWLLSDGDVDAVIVGAERIEPEGDARSALGTYALAVLARHHGRRFVVCAASSAIAPDAGNLALTPGSIPAGDRIPNNLITAIVTERGVAPTTD
jgi:methylthioribose-1-phosphate isomerase